MAAHKIIRIKFLVLFFFTGAYICNAQNGQMKVNTYNPPLLTLNSAMVFKSNSATLPFISAGVLTVTDNSINEARVASFTQKVNPTGNWWLNYTYTASGAKSGDGLAVVFHNDLRGLNAVGGCGGLLGCGAANCSYGSAITPSVDFEMNMYTGAGNVGVKLNTNGGTGGYVATSPLNIASGNPIDVLMKYNASTTTLTVLLTDNIAGTSWTTSYTINFNTAVGASAYLAFTGGTGSATVTQTITKVFFRGAKG
jgi:hypothetical protein